MSSFPFSMFRGHIRRISVGSSSSWRNNLLPAIKRTNYTFPRSLKNMTGLEYLRFDIDRKGAGFRGQFPLFLTRLTNLTHLNLQSNRFMGSIPAALADLSHLNYLGKAGLHETQILFLAHN